MIEIEFAMPDFDDFKANALVAATADSMLAAGTAFLERRLNERFKAGAFREFGWTPRTAKYQIRKAKRKGTTADMVFSGELRRMALTEAKPRVNRRSLRLRIAVPVPAYADIRRKRTGDSLRQELVRMSDKDKEMMLDFVAKDLPERLATDPKYRVRAKRRAKA